MYTWLKSAPADINTKLDGLTKERAKQLVEHIQPAIRDDGKLCHIELPDLFNRAFNWDPEVKDPVKGAQIVAVIETYHRCGYHGIFKPSIAEVLAQIPTQFITDKLVFETQFGDDGAIIDSKEFYGHRATTTLYKYE